MWSDQNGAPQAVRYLNAQLAVLHENAKMYLQNNPQARCEGDRKHYALAEFTVQRPGAASFVPSETDSLLHLRFAQPKIMCICDHDALLHLTVEEGYVVLDTLKAGRGQVTQLRAGFRMTYRVSFETRAGLVDIDPEAGDSGSNIELVVLDLKTAAVSAVHPEQLNDCDDALHRYLTQYFDLLHDAGSHILVSLPQFSQDATRMQIAYSLMEQSERYGRLAVIHGMTVEQINARMTSLWLEFVKPEYGSITANTANSPPRCLVECICIDNDRYFRIKFSAPHASILCSKELVLEFEIDEVEFFDDEDSSGPPVQKYSGWKVSMVVNVLRAESTDGAVRRIMCDFLNPRYHHPRSAYAGLDERDEASLRYRVLIFKFFVEHLEVLHRAGCHVLYERDALWESLKDPESSEGGCRNQAHSENSCGVSLPETLQQARMFGFDQVVTIPQESLNIHFKSREPLGLPVFYWGDLYQHLSCTCGPLSLRLLSNERAIIWVPLTKGRMLFDFYSDEGYEFRDWRIAFEVELKMCTHEALEGASSATFMGTSAYKEHANRPDRELNHIFLDLRNADYIPECSIYDDLPVDADDSPAYTLTLQAVISYLTQDYFPAFCKEGRNVICSVPVWKTAGLSLPSYAPTNVTFHVYSPVEVARHNWAHLTPGQEPIIVVLGMTGFRPLPAARLELSTGWVAHANRDFSHGILSIARRVFIEEHVLGVLSGVNAQTTFIPLIGSDPIRGVSLRRWADHKPYEDRSYGWDPLPSDENCLKYTWNHSEELRFHMGPSGDTATLDMLCWMGTTNYMELVTVSQGALHIKVHGTVILCLTLETVGSQWSRANSWVSWSTNVLVQTTSSGIKITPLGSFGPFFVTTPFTAGDVPEHLRYAADILRRAFPDKVALGDSDFMQEIFAFDDMRPYCYALDATNSLSRPVFNSNGDLLLELSLRDADSRAPPGCIGFPTYGPAVTCRLDWRSAPKKVETSIWNRPPKGSGAELPVTGSRRARGWPWGFGRGG